MNEPRPTVVRLLNGPLSGRIEYVPGDGPLPETLEVGAGWIYALSKAKPEPPAEALYVFAGNEN